MQRAAQLLVVINELDGADPSTLDENDPIAEDLEQALAWADAGGLDPSLFGEGFARLKEFYHPEMELECLKKSYLL